MNILITGASSGIGAALALHYAIAGNHLYLSGRHRERLTTVADECRRKGAAVDINIIDVTDRTGMAAWIEDIDKRTSLDLVIANAGVSGGTGGSASGFESADQVRTLFDINVTGVFNTIDPVLPRMKARGQGQIAIMSSLASFCGWPGAPAYSAAKGAVRLYGEALRGRLRDSGVKINVICPGFIRTPMTAVNNYAMPFMMDADRAATIIARGLVRNRGRIAFPWPTYLFAGFFGLLPPALTLRFLSRMPEKPVQSPS